MICKSFIPCVTVLGLWTGSAAAQAPESSKDKATQEEKIVIGGKEFAIIPAEKLRAHGFDVPQIPRERNAFWVYVEAINAAKDVPPDLRDAFEPLSRGGIWPEGDTGERLAAWLKENKPAIDLVRRATAMPDYALPPMASPGADVTVSSILLPILSPERQLARLLAGEAAALHAHGQSDAAMENYLTMQRMGNQIASGNLLIEGLVGMAINSLAEQGIMSLAQSGSVSPNALKAALADLEQIAGSQPNWQRMLEGERRFEEAFVDDAVDVPGAMWTMGTGFVIPPEQYEPNGWSELVRRLKRLYLPDRTVKKQIHQYYDTLTAAGRPREDGTVVTIEEDNLFKDFPIWNFPARILLPSLSRAYEITLMGQSNFERARLSLAVAAYRADHGELPPSLSALTPAYAASIPPDPMTGYEFEYQVVADSPGGYRGLERVTRENEAELQKKRRTPAILNPRASRWKRYVQSVCDRYRFTDSQRTAAEAILRDMESRAAQYEQAQGVKLRELVEAGRSDELVRRLGPLDLMFDELKQRLEALPDAKQRAAASQPAATQPDERTQGQEAL